MSCSFISGEPGQQFFALLLLKAEGAVPKKQARVFVSAPENDDFFMLKTCVFN
jgi:hypothetical protein